MYLLFISGDAIPQFALRNGEISFLFPLFLVPLLYRYCHTYVALEEENVRSTRGRKASVGNATKSGNDMLTFVFACKRGIK